MPSLRLPVVAVLCGAGLLGWSVGGVASVRDAAVAPVPGHHQGSVTDQHHHGREHGL